MAEYVIANAPAAMSTPRSTPSTRFAYTSIDPHERRRREGQLLDGRRQAREIRNSPSNSVPTADTAGADSPSRTGCQGVLDREVRCQRLGGPPRVEHAGLADRVTCINGTVDDATTLDVLAEDYGFTEGCLDFVFPSTTGRTCTCPTYSAWSARAGCISGTIVVATTSASPAHPSTVPT